MSGWHCEYASLRRNIRSYALHCGQVQRDVIRLSRCPDGYWWKDAKGWPTIAEKQGELNHQKVLEETGVLSWESPKGYWSNNRQCFIMEAERYLKESSRKAELEQPVVTARRGLNSWED